MRDCPPICPYLAPHRESALGFPVGQVRRLAPADDAAREEVDETKRNVIKLLAVAGAVGAGAGGLVAGSLQYAQPPVVGISAYPKTALVDLDGSPLTATKVMNEYNVTTSELLIFYYPLRNEPNFLLNLAPPPGGSGGATNVVGGVGPQGSIVAFSAICQHLGCPAPAISYYPPGTCSKTFGTKTFYIHCSCHGSTYDVTNGAANLTGPAVLPLPQVTLDWDQSDDSISAIGETGPPVNGHFSTLTGDYSIGNTSQLTRETPVIACFFPS
jgi:Rieske Fe-S protein